MKSNQKLTLFQGIGLLVSTLLGSSIFVVPAMAASQLGEQSIWGWIIIMLCVLPVAFCFSSLGTSYPNEGGTAFFIRQAFGERLERFTAWLFLSALPMGPPIIIITGAAYLGSIWQLAPAGILAIELVTLGLLFLSNRYGLQFMSRIQSLMTLVILAILTTLIGRAFWAADLFRSLPPAPSLASMPSLWSAMGLLFWCFVGIEAVAHLSESFKNVKRDFPLTIFSSIAIVGGICLLLGIIVVRYHAYGTPALNANYMVYLFARLFGGPGEIFVAVMAFFTCLASVNLYMVSFSKMLHAMSLTGDLPAGLQATNRHNVPVRAMAVCYGIVAGTLLLCYAIALPLEELILYANTVFVAVYLLASLAGVVLLRGFRLFTAMVSTLFCGAVFFSLGNRCLYVALLFVGVNAVEYILYRRQIVSGRREGLLEARLK